MKKLRIPLLLTLLAASLTSAAADPVLIGRRGCAGGVENSVEAYREAVKRGYTMIEGHVRVTADSVFVTSHDGKTARLGGALKVEESPYADLKAERYTQTREDSVTYTGSICTVSDFLGICRDGGATAVLHLKAFPKGTHEGHLDALADLISKVTSPDSVLVLTSSPEYIDYLRARHPELPLMFQAEKTWPERIEWCRERGLGIDLEKKLLTPECVKAYHDAGLKIAVWTVNDPEEARSLPVDYIITDTLLPGSF